MGWWFTGVYCKLTARRSDKNVKELQNEDRLKKKGEKGICFFFTGELIAPSSVQEEEC